MAAVVKCDCCGAVIPYNKAKHIRCYNLSSATTYNGNKTILQADICNDCYDKLKKALDTGGDTNAD